jgi:hypothetical protein
MAHGVLIHEGYDVESIESRSDLGIDLSTYARQRELAIDVENMKTCGSFHGETRDALSRIDTHATNGVVQDQGTDFGG